jgi:hypothetical protein
VADHEQRPTERDPARHPLHHFVHESRDMNN